MGAKTSIEWTRNADGSPGATWNPIRARNIDGFVPNGERRAMGHLGWYCEHVSPGCERCYAESMNHRLGTGLPFRPGHRKDVEIFLDEKMLLAPLRWKKPRRIFVNSMSDTFADFVRVEWIDRMFAVMARCPQHEFQVLTKRAERMHDYMRGKWRIPEQFAKQILEMDNFKWPPPNCWLGVSAEDQQRADERIPLLLETPAAVRFVSLEPLLGPITLWSDQEGLCRGPGVKIGGGVTVSTPDNPPEGYDDSQPWLDWVIVGGESGPSARPCHPDWVRSLQEQCKAAEVPFFFKQWGAWLPWEPEHDPCWKAQNGRSEDAHALFPVSFDDDPSWDDGLWAVEESHAAFQRVGKKAAGRLLDGVEWNQMPERS
jgi:protein gp37